MKGQVLTRKGSAIVLAGACTFGTAIVSAQGTSTSAGAAGRQSTAAGAASPASPATALQDARVTLARLTERSMTQDAREALARLSTDFRALYKAYTGEDPDPQTTATAAAPASGAAPAGDWKRRYEAVTASLTSLIGPQASTAAPGTAGTSGQVGTSGTTGSAPSSGMPELTREVRDELTLLRDQLNRFFHAAGGGSAPASSPSAAPGR